ncbi:MAG: 50S ribosomal protein L30 [Deltaproteobacteria bacterium]|nr:50S ribosomal protein L30 [Deltaproteobacteria bacterium]
MAKIKITLIRSMNGKSEAQRKVARGLGLRKINSVVTLEDTPSIRGMLNKAPHLFAVQGE